MNGERFLVGQLFACVGSSLPSDPPALSVAGMYADQSLSYLPIHSSSAIFVYPSTACVSLSISANDVIHTYIHNLRCVFLSGRFLENACDVFDEGIVFVFRPFDGFGLPGFFPV